MEKKTIVISKNTHTKLKKYCDEECIKLNEWVDKLIQKELENVQKKMSDLR